MHGMCSACVCLHTAANAAVHHRQPILDVSLRHARCRQCNCTPQTNTATVQPSHLPAPAPHHQCQQQQPAPWTAAPPSHTAAAARQGSCSAQPLLPRGLRRWPGNTAAAAMRQQGISRRHLHQHLMLHSNAQHLNNPTTAASTHTTSCAHCSLSSII